MIFSYSVNSPGHNFDGINFGHLLGRIPAINREAPIMDFNLAGQGLAARSQFQTTAEGDAFDINGVITLECRVADSYLHEVMTIGEGQLPLLFRQKMAKGVINRVFAALAGLSGVIAAPAVNHAFG